VTEDLLVDRVCKVSLDLKALLVLPVPKEIVVLMEQRANKAILVKLAVLVKLVHKVFKV